MRSINQVVKDVRLEVINKVVMVIGHTERSDSSAMLRLHFYAVCRLAIGGF